jgi:hypothetical protein
MYADKALSTNQEIEIASSAESPAQGRRIKGTDIVLPLKIPR